MNKIDIKINYYKIYAHKFISRWNETLWNIIDRNVKSEIKLVLKLVIKNILKNARSNYRYKPLND